VSPTPGGEMTERERKLEAVRTVMLRHGLRSPAAVVAEILDAVDAAARVPRPRVADRRDPDAYRELVGNRCGAPRR
jgi:hypothetical protein